MKRHDDDEPSVWQTPDPPGAQERVRRLEQAAAELRERSLREAEISHELEDIYNALALARIDLAAHRRQRVALDDELAQRRSDNVLRQRREVVELFEETERKLLDGGVGGARLEAAQANLRMAREELARADAERARLR